MQPCNCPTCANTHPDEGSTGIANAEMLCNVVAARYENPISVNGSTLSGIPEPLMMQLAQVNSNVAVAKELRLLRKSLEMMFLGGTSPGLAGAQSVLDVSDTMTPHDDPEHPA